MLLFSKNFSSVIKRIALTGPCAAVLPSAYFSTTSQRNCGTKSDERLDVNSKGSNKEDRSRVIPVEVAIKYLKSSAYQQTYGEQLVWEQYKRNHKGLYPPKKTRKTCIRNNIVSTGNPCPICRDEYLVLDYRNINLLQQFICPHTGEVLNYSKTGLCQKRHLQLMVAVEQAKDRGLIEYNVPFRKYNYSDYYGKSFKHISEEL